MKNIDFIFFRIFFLIGNASFCLPFVFLSLLLPTLVTPNISISFFVCLFVCSGVFLTNRVRNYGITLANLSRPGGKCLLPTPGWDLFHSSSIFSMAGSWHRGRSTDHRDRRTELSPKPCHSLSCVSLARLVTALNFGFLFIYLIWGLNEIAHIKSIAYGDIQ